MEWDIAEGKPREMTRPNGNAKKLATLERQAAFAGVVDSDACKKLTEMIEKELFREIERLLHEAPTTRPYVMMLNELGRGKALARRATDTLMKKWE